MALHCIVSIVAAEEFEYNVLHIYWVYRGASERVGLTKEWVIQRLTFVRPLARDGVAMRSTRGDHDPRDRWPSTQFGGLSIGPQTQEPGRAESLEIRSS